MSTAQCCQTKAAPECPFFSRGFSLMIDKINRWFPDEQKSNVPLNDDSVPSEACSAALSSSNHGEAPIVDQARFKHKTLLPPASIPSPNVNQNTTNGPKYLLHLGKNPNRICSFFPVVAGDIIVHEPTSSPVKASDPSARPSDSCELSTVCIPFIRLSICSFTHLNSRILITFPKNEGCLAPSHQVRLSEASVTFRPP